MLVMELLGCGADIGTKEIVPVQTPLPRIIVADRLIPVKVVVIAATL
jgi:hypothetical protein